MRLEIVFEPSYGMLKHNESNKNLGQILSSFVNENSILLFSFYERNMNLYDESVQKFILERCVFVNSEWVLPWAETIPHWDESNAPPKIIWFSPTGKDEILQAIEIDNLFRCVVVKKGKDFNHFSNVLFHQEYYSSIDEEEDYEYCLCFTDKYDFLNDVLPDIKERFKVSVIE